MTPDFEVCPSGTLAQLAAVTEERDAFMASSRIAQANETLANARLAFMIHSAGQAFELPSGWRCTWICDYGDERETNSHRTAFDAIDAAMLYREELRVAREIESTGPEQ